MNVSYRWLSDYIDLSGIPAEQLAEMMTRGGIEIDSVPSRNAGVTGVVVGYVKKREKHPDADKLSVCTVDAGTGEDLQIVCGAQNVGADMKVPVAVVGAKLPGGLNIKRAKLRGVESQGMICSARELGINDKLLPKEQQEGILVLPPETEIGRDILDVLALDDSILELDLTPNRSDCLSMLGVAYEVSALTGRPLNLPDPAKDIYSAAEVTSDYVRVSISSPEHCSLYTARYIKGVKVAPAPQWIQNRLIAAGVRPINNIVDITNYVMLEYGQPLHAFDAGKVAGGRIDVRLAQAGETLVTLDDQERKLEPHMLVIADAEKAIGLAGVMGGANSEVSEGTTDIILESAKFDGSTVRRTSRQLGLRSEASARFEKEVDQDRVRAALDRAAGLIARYAEGLVTEGVAEAEVSAKQPAVIDLSLSRVNGMLGTELSSLEIKTILSRLQFKVEASGDDIWKVTVPSRRGDISRDVDLVEEIARLHGYDEIPTTPIEGPTTPGSLTKPQAIRRELRTILTGAGLHEAISYSVTSLPRTELFAELAAGAKPIALAMPMSEERSVLRTTLIPSLLEAAAYNLNRKNNDVALFEIGNVYHTDETTLTRLPNEKPRAALLLLGNRRTAAWNRTAEPVDFYDAKGVLEQAFDRLGLTGRISYEAAQPAGFHPGRTAAIVIRTERGSETIGYVGQVHPETQREFDLPDAYVAELELEPIYEYADASIEYRILPRYPAIERDIAVVVDRSVAGGALTETIAASAGELLESVKVFDVYTGERIGSDKKSVAVALVYRHAERTLTDEEVGEAHARVLVQLEQSYGAELRK
ncbi:phenylalanine--tRNA ligase subunit beta [Cohnella sp. CIP 111063]|uniref:phenylalanine--tRNA ligase subunit beta n=1 Tax=unclassified Cohnella TaxID=2636738 RepID=UPI000B8C2FD9|nr:MULTISPECIES: phenylalanine--tRNA ligase subunit beta [unclassified Cohnella]OXS58442.1 phenylalanine--tRNA ligase subunit beta [Cohnella sp. CIP 111063]PRX71735.1 phenylalanyl-tRNA synthetase beta subunit [Cohnella sp. SGD-V74]